MLLCQEHVRDEFKLRSYAFIEGDFSVFNGIPAQQVIDIEAAKIVSPSKSTAVDNFLFQTEGHDPLYPHKSLQFSEMTYYENSNVAREVPDSLLELTQWS